MAALFTRMICADCDAVIAPTPKISRLLAGYGVHCPVRIIPTGLDLQRFAVPRDDALHSRLGLPPKEANKTVLLSLGRLAKEKTQQNLSILCRICRTPFCSSSATARSAPRWNSRRKASAWLTA